MAVYLATIAICSAFSFLAAKRERKDISYYVFALLPFIALFIVSGIRYDVGKDYTDTYVYIFNLVKNNVADIRADIGLIWICKFLVKWDFDVQWLFVITSFIINLYICKSVKIQSKAQALSLFIYICGTLYFFSMNGVRQTVAMTLFYYSLRYVEEKKIKQYLIYNGIGCLFHLSAIIFLPLYFVLSKKINVKIKYALIALMFVFSKTLLPYINDFLMGTKYAMYLTNGAYSALETFNISSVMNIGFMVLYDLFSHYENEKDRIYSNCHFCGVLVSIFMISLPLVLRMFVYFRYIEYLSVPNLVERFKHKRAIKICVVVFYFIYFIHGVYIENGNAVLPYMTIFSR